MVTPTALPFCPHCRFFLLWPGDTHWVCTECGFAREPNERERASEVWQSEPHSTRDT